MNSRINRTLVTQAKKNPFLRARQNKFLQRNTNANEHFNANLQFRPYELYIVTDETGKYALTCEDGSNSIFLSTPDDKNKNQWVFMDSDTGNNRVGISGGSTGTIAFFNPTDGYLSIDFKGEVYYVTRDHSLLDTIFEYEGINGMIKLRDKPNYVLAFKRVAEKQSETILPEETNTQGTPEGSPADAANAENYVIRSVKRAMRERFNKETEPQLEVVNKNSMDKKIYSYRWTWHRVVDLREFIRNAEVDAQNKKMLEESSNKADAQQKVIKNLELQRQTDNAYYNAIIKGYEDLPGIKWFNKVSATLGGTG